MSHRREAISHRLKVAIRRSRRPSAISLAYRRGENDMIFSSAAANAFYW